MWHKKGQLTESMAHMKALGPKHTSHDHTKEDGERGA